MLSSSSLSGLAAEDGEGLVISCCDDIVSGRVKGEGVNGRAGVELIAEDFGGLEGFLEAGRGRGGRRMGEVSSRVDIGLSSSGLTITLSE